MKISGKKSMGNLLKNLSEVEAYLAKVTDVNKYRYGKKHKLYGESSLNEWQKKE